MNEGESKEVGECSRVSEQARGGSRHLCGVADGVEAHEVLVHIGGAKLLHHRPLKELSWMVGGTSTRQSMHTQIHDHSNVRRRT